jgi:hypothetical protein
MEAILLIWPSIVEIVPFLIVLHSVEINVHASFSLQFQRSEATAKQAPPLLSLS